MCVLSSFVVNDGRPLYSFTFISTFLAHPRSVEQYSFTLLCFVPQPPQRAVSLQRTVQNDQQNLSAKERLFIASNTNIKATNLLMERRETRKERLIPQYLNPETVLGSHARKFSTHHFANMQWRFPHSDVLSQVTETNPLLQSTLQGLRDSQ